MIRRRLNKMGMERFHHHRSRWYNNCCCCCCCNRRPVVLVSLIIILGIYQLVLLHTSHVMKMNTIGDWNLHHDDELPQLHQQTTTTNTTTTTATTSTTTTPTTPPTTKKPIVIAYAISVTSCQYNDTSSRVSVLDGAAILGHSIHLSSIRSGAGTGGIDGRDGSSNATLLQTDRDLSTTPNSSMKNTTTMRSKSNYDYKLYAFVYGETVDEQCQDTLSQLGYTVIVKYTLPFDISNIHDDTLRELIDSKGCCGSKEYIKLYSYTLLHHPIVVHLDIDSIILQPLDIVFDNILNNMRIESRRREVELDAKHIQRRGGQSNMPSMEVGNARIDDDDDDDYYYDHFFYYTRDYYQQTKHSIKNPLKYGIQGGFFIITPSLHILNILTSNILHETYTKKHGWSNKGYNGFWGDTQIQGFLSYAYSYYGTDGYFIINHNNGNVNTTDNRGGDNRSNNRFPTSTSTSYADSATTGTGTGNTNDDNNTVHVRAVELNRCVYDSMINDDPYYYDNKKRGAKIMKDPAKRKCRTEEEVCEDCRETPFENIKTIHYTTCRKPWECPYLKPPQPTLCKDAHFAWYKIRQQLELSWGYQPPSTGNWHYERTLGYCNRMINNSNDNNETATATNSTNNNGKRNNKQRQYIPIEYPFGLY